MKAKNYAIILFILILLAFSGFIYEIVQINSAHSYAHSLENQVTSLQGQLATANNQISSLQRIVNLQESQTIISNSTINGTSGQVVKAASFTASYMGYVRIIGTTTTTNGYIVVNDVSYQFGTGGTVSAPVLPGNVTVSFGNTNFINGATATLTVTYVY